MTMISLMVWNILGYTLNFQKTSTLLDDVHFSCLDSDLQRNTSSRHRGQSVNVFSVYDNGYFGLEPSNFDTAEQ